jgi:hypothetical protein
MPDDNENLDGQGDQNQDQSQSDEQKQTQAFHSMLDVDMQKNPSITKFKDVKELAKSYVELQKLVGTDKIKVPNDKSTPEEWNAFWDKAGRPKDVKEYEVPQLDIPEAVRMRQESLEAFKAKAHELGLNKKQFAQLYALYNETSLAGYNQQLEAAGKVKTEAETALRKEWGAAYEAKVDRAQQFINKFFKGKEIHPAFSVLSSDKGFISAMAAAAESMSEDSLSGLTRTTMTPQEATSEINAMMGDPKHPLHNDIHPEHNAAVDKLLELRALVEAGNQSGQA